MQPNRSPDTAVLGIVGGSGLYDLPDLSDRREEQVETPFGAPSDTLVHGRIGDQRIVFLSRHGRGHRLNPSDLPYRANIYALKAAGVTHLLSVSAVGSLRAEVAPRHLLVPDQIIDRTTLRPRTFFDAGCVAHVGLAVPFCQHLRQAVLHAAGGTGTTVHDGGGYVCIEGPQFSTRAESLLYRSWGASIIGMTAMPEARLAREAEIAYVTLALVTDYDVWHDSEADVSVEMVTQNVVANVEAAKLVIRRLIDGGLPEPDAASRDALRGAIMTDPSAIAPDVSERLGVILQRYHGSDPSSS